MMCALARARRVTRGCALAGALAGSWGIGWTAPQAASAPASTRVAEPPPGCHGWEDAAVSRVAARVRRERLYAAWSKPGCLDFFVDACSARTVDVTIHEKHDARCGGDPATWPRVDSFRVYRRGARIDWYNLVDDAWRPFDKIHSEGHR